MKTRYRLKLESLKFCSVVDNPAQPNAKTLLIKRAPAGDAIEATAKFLKASDELGLAFFWAFTSTNADGTPHHDLQGDAIDPDFMKSAMDFMLEGGAVDEMHDGEAGAGRVVFAMPMDPSIASAYGLVTKQTGLMVAIKVRPDVLAKLKDGTYNGVSIAGTGTRELVKRALFSRVVKQGVLTSEVDGHQHTVDVDDPSQSWCASYQTSYQTAAGASDGHSHAWTFDANGAVTIGEDSGHSHTLPATVPADVLVAYAAQQAAQDARNLAPVTDAVPCSVTDEPSSGKTVVVIAARAPAARKSPPAASAIKAVTTSPENTAMPTEQDTKIADLTKRNERLERIAKMSGPHKTHLDTLTGDAAEDFLAKSAAERGAALAEIEKANEVVYTSTSDGTVYRKSDGEKLVAMAKRQDAQAVEIAKRDEAIEKAEIRKVAADCLGSVAGDDDTHDYIVKSIRKGGGDAAMVEKALTTLKSVKAFTKQAGIAKGVGGSDAPADPGTQLEQLVAKHATENKLSIEKSYAAVVDTAEGKRLYGEIQAAKKAKA